jgi:hypothetical protein
VTLLLTAPLDGPGLDAVAQLALLARRLGWQLEVQAAGPEPDPLLVLSGLLDVLDVRPGPG